MFRNSTHCCWALGALMPLAILCACGEDTELELAGVDGDPEVTSSSSTGLFPAPAASSPPSLSGQTSIELTGLAKARLAAEAAEAAT